MRGVCHNRHAPRAGLRYHICDMRELSTQSDVVLLSLLSTLSLAQLSIGSLSHSSLSQLSISYSSHKALSHTALTQLSLSQLSLCTPAMGSSRNAAIVSMSFSVLSSSTKKPSNARDDAGDMEGAPSRCCARRGDRGGEWHADNCQETRKASQDAGNDEAVQAPCSF